MKWEEGMMEESERIQRHSIDFCLFHQERREELVQCDVDLILATRQVVTAHPHCEIVN